MQSADASHTRAEYLFDEPSIVAGLEAVAASGVIAYPTEAVWGLGCDPFSEAAVAKLLEEYIEPFALGDKHRGAQDRRPGKSVTPALLLAMQ